jgi:predicted secreted protein
MSLPTSIAIYFIIWWMVCSPFCHGACVANMKTARSRRAATPARL